MPSKHTDRHSSSGHSKQKTSTELVLHKAKASKTPKTSPGPSSPSNTMIYKPNSMPNASDLAIWKTVKNNISDENAMVVFVGDSQDKKSLKRFLAEEKDFKKQSHHGDVDIFRPQKSSISTVMVANPNELQDALKAAAKMRYDIVGTPASSGWFSASKPAEKRTITPTKLLIIVSRSISMIAYDISCRIMKATVMLSYPTPADNDMYSLCIDDSSSYCGVETYKWQYRSDYRDRHLMHDEGIFFDTTSLTKKGLSFSPNIMSAMTPELSEQCQQAFRGCIEEKDGYGASGRSPSREAPAFAQTDTKVRWFEKWLGLIATITGAALGITEAAAKFSFCWISGGGFHVKGPLGFFLSMGYSALGITCSTNIGAAFKHGAPVGSTVYYVPWERLWDCVKMVLGAVWEKIKEYAVWIWEKVKSWAADVASALRQGLTGDAFPHMPKPKSARLDV